MNTASTNQTDESEAAESPKLDAEKFLLVEYSNTLQEMSRYDNDSTKLSQLLGVLIFGTSFFSSAANSQVLFAFMPFLSILAGFLLATNQYAYAAREKYIVELERMIAHFSLIGPRFYSTHVVSYWHSNRFTLNIFLPVRGTFWMINFLLFAVLIMGTYRTYDWIASMDVTWAQSYVGIVVIGFLLFLGSMHSGWYRLAQIHIKIVDSTNTKLGKLLS